MLEIFEEFGCVGAPSIYEVSVIVFNSNEAI